MRRRKSVLSFSFLLALTSAPGFAGDLASAKTGESAEAGRVLFETFACRRCHRLGNVGGNSGPDLTLVGFRRSREWLALWLKDPKAWDSDTLMPNYGLSKKSIDAIADFLSEQRGQEYPRTLPWDEPSLRSALEARGKVVYLRAGCVACHGPQGRGGEPNNNVPGGLIPALDHLRETFSMDELKMKIRRGVLNPVRDDPSGPRPLVFMPRWEDVLTGEDIDAVAAYLFSLESAKTVSAEW